MNADAPTDLSILRRAFEAACGPGRWPKAALLAAPLLLLSPTLALSAKGAVLVAAIHTAMIPLSSAWRWHGGLMPSLDFPSPLGWLYYALHAWAGDVFGFTAGKILLGAPLLAWPWLAGSALLVAGRRLPALAGTAFVLLCGSSILAPNYPDAGPDTLVFLADYDSMGWVVACIAALWALVPPVRGIGERADAAEAALLGALLAATFYLKASFFGGAAALVFLAPFLETRDWRWTAVALGIPVLAAVAVEAIWPGYHLAYLRDMLQALAAQDSAVRNPNFPGLTKLHLDLLANAAALAGGLAGAGALAWIEKSSTGVRRSVAAALALGLGLLMGNQAHPHIEPMGAAVLTLLAGRAAPLAREIGVKRLVPAGLALLLLWVAGDQIWTGTRAVAVNRAAATSGRAIPAERAGDPAFADLFLAPIPGDKGLRADGKLGANAPAFAGPKTYQDVFTDGVEALKGIAGPRSRIQAIMFANPFPFLLGTPPVKGTPTWWNLGRTVSERHPPAGASIVGDADIVMIPTWYYERNTVDLLTYQAAYDLTLRFQPVRSTPYWTIWILKPAGRSHIPATPSSRTSP